ncbi:B12-binding domain-containing radical SAM protein [Hymenobacter latericus]|uniref:B12-binding domain-containing radical SAM protein n=1 Tax=Hymenobacter sp. YIM 151858-1 TaxID=2987688 RepID=UPI002227BC58|nr:radical SAM protein [Hymenobacter sp. YIM 151858-1]UYZ58859.1 radical SAM protein [Hymenobacter sp. YIM 151858-1]
MPTNSTPRILLITPPLTQLNTPYPATAYITGFLRGQGFQVAQADLGIELVLKLFSAAGLRRVFDAVEQGAFELSDNARRMLRLRRRYEMTIEPVIRFLQNKDLTLASRICHGRYLPEAARFDQVADLETAFGTMGLTDQARHLATLYLEDLNDLIKETVGPQFGLSRYAEHLGLTATSFEPLHTALQQAPNLVDEMLLELGTAVLEREQPDVVGFTVPFPGNLYGALRLAKHFKQLRPEVKTLMGGGYPNTELRQIQEPRFFDYIDYLTLDDGEGPWLKLLEFFRCQLPLESCQLSVASCQENVAYQTAEAATVDNPTGNAQLTTDNSPLATQFQRTFHRNALGQVEYLNGCQDANIPHTEVGTPDYDGLPLTEYLSVIEVLNPMHRLWSDGRWNKLTVAHGCYWKRCSFCDVTLDYISRYETAPATLLVDRIEQIVRQTGQTGFHFVDEAAPPLALRDLAIELLKRRVSITWWGNIRFEKTFSPDLCRLLAASGCIAVSGGLEVASDRLLALMEKGVSIAQVARVTDGFTQAGIMVHAYLMYGFPTETAQETIDSLEVVRQLLAAGVVQSGFWHRFAMTAHSPVGKNPAKYQVRQIGPAFEGFAWNDLWHDDPTGADHEQFGPGLAKALYNYMHGVALDEPLQFWFDFRVPRTTVPRNLIESALTEPGKPDSAKQNMRVFWLGNAPEIRFETRQKKGRQIEQAVLTFYEQAEDFELKTTPVIGRWLHQLLGELSFDYDTKRLLKEVAATYPAAEAGLSFEAFMISPQWLLLREKGLLLV